MGSANDDEHDSWAPAKPPTLSPVSNDVGYTQDAISRLSLELGTVRSELCYARVCVLFCAVMPSLSDPCK